MKKNWLGDELDRNGWPVAVPILGPRDFCVGVCNIGPRCCMIGWAAAVTSSSPYGDNNKKRLVVLDAIRRAIAAKGYNTGIVNFNDRVAKPRDRARVWNTAMRDLGYKVPASACK